MSALVTKRRHKLTSVRHQAKQAQLTLQSQKLEFRRVRAGQQRELASLQEVRRLQRLYYPRAPSVEDSLTPYEFARLRFLKWQLECLSRFNLTCKVAAAHAAIVSAITKP